MHFRTVRRSKWITKTVEDISIQYVSSFPYIETIDLYQFEHGWLWLWDGSQLSPRSDSDRCRGVENPPHDHLSGK